MGHRFPDPNSLRRDSPCQCDPGTITLTTTINICTSSSDQARKVTRQATSAQSNVVLGLINETKITLLTEQGVYYRGRNVVGLAETESFEAVAALLWEADVQAIFTEQVLAVPASYGKLKRSLADLTVA